MDKNFALISLGCPKNLVDSENMVGILKSAGFNPVDNPVDADVIIVNTCSFIRDAKEESIETILDLIRFKKGKCRGFIVCGCLPEMYRENVLNEIPEVDAIVGTGAICSIGEIVEKVLQGYKGSRLSEPGSFAYPGFERCVSTGPSHAYLKIAEGCDNRCTYCVIPSLRGKYRSRDQESIIQEAEWLSRNGFSELILVAQDTTRYGMDLYGKPMLPELISRLNSIDNIKWIRLLYCYPDFINKKFIDNIFANNKLLHYIDIPLQHASGNVLRRMGRKGNGDEYLEMINMLRSEIPDMVIRTSIIAGFPGETDRDFETLLDFIKAARFDRLGVFEYSKEENTPAAKLKNQVSKKMKKARHDKIMSVQKEIMMEKNRDRIGKEYETVIEGVSDDGLLYKGRTYAESPEIDPVVYLAARKDLKPGEYVRARIIDINEYDLIGDVSHESSE